MSNRNLIGEVFVHLTQDDTLERLSTCKASIQTDISNLEKRCDEHRQTLSDLKVQLYAKFGNNINLEAEDE